MDIAEIERWFEDHVAPDIKKVAGWVQAHAANAQALAALVESLVKTFDPSEYPEVAALVETAEKVAAEAVKVYNDIKADL